MCGIAGFAALPGHGKSGQAQAVLDSIQHRGPDDRGWLRLTGTKVERGREWTPPAREPEALLLHRRLSIIDTSDGGWQPMSTAGGRYHVVFNGEIYNYVELRSELQALGHRFHSASDTEVLLSAIAQWGAGALRRFIGMFALALLDTERRTLLLARDFFGIKPLFYWEETGSVFFASEIKALTAFGLTRPRVNAERLLLYLRYGLADFGCETMLSQVRQVPPAHFLEISLDNCRADEPKCYWAEEPGEELDISFDEAAARVRELFLRNVELHLRSDVPIGLALSGGIDSSSIMAAIRYLNPKAEIHAFSFISEDAAISEEKWVDLAGREAGARVHKVRATAADLVHDLDSMVQFHDEPFGSTSAYAQFQVFRAAHGAGIKVMLDGQGADEILAGYDQYKGARLASMLRQGRLGEASRFLRSLSNNGGMGAYLGVAFGAEFLLPPALQGAARALVGRDAYPAWLRRSWFKERDADVGTGNFTTTRNVLRNSLSRSVAKTLPGLLRYEDRNSMAWSVESRVPFLTPELSRFLGRLPESYLIDGQGTSKAVFRKAMRGIAPGPILDRHDKIGFATPERWWLAQLDGWVRSALEGEVAATLPFLNLGPARRELDAVRSGSRPFGFHIWRWVNLIRWTEKMQVVYE
ncbi:MAG: asparagine synthase (glutamine-hydrolyzing) [Terracidiphilus sp.]